VTDGIAVVFSFFFRCPIYKVTEQLSSKLGHTFTYDCYLKHLNRTLQGIYTPQVGNKKHFEKTLNLDRTYMSATQRNMISTIGKKLVNLQRLPYTPSNLVNFGPETAENGWRVLAHP